MDSYANTRVKRIDDSGKNNVEPVGPQATPPQRRPPIAAGLSASQIQLPANQDKHTDQTSHKQTPDA